jgi:hypothetical protein
MSAHRLGAIFFALWGLMHVAFGSQMLMLNASGSAKAVLDAFYLDTGLVPTPDQLGSTLDAIFNQHAWNLLWFGLASTVVAVAFNWRNSRGGYWANMVLIAAADLGFIVAVMMPGFIDFWIGIWGPVLWIAGAIFASIGRMQTRG